MATVESSAILASDDKEAVVIKVPRITSRTFTGPSNPQNKNAIDWGSHGLLAFGSNYTVLIVDTVNVQLLQCLDRHKSMVKKVLWGRDYLSQDKPTSSPRLYGVLDVVSADATGHIIVWDVCTAVPTTVLQDGTKPILDMSWVNDWDGNNHLLCALHPPYSFILWDTRLGTKLWKKTYTESLLSFCFDPFHHSKLAFHCSECVLFVEDFSVKRIPSSNGRKFYVSSPKTRTGDERNAKERLKRVMKDLVVGDMRPKPDDGMTLAECLQISYHKSIRHHMILLYPKEILIIDLHINQTVGLLPLGDKAASPFLQVVTSWQRDVLFCLHDNGSVSAKFRKQNLLACSPLDAPAPSISSLETNGDAVLELLYENKCHSESMRQMRGLQVLGLAVNPVCERRLAVYLNSGKIVFLELQLVENGSTTIQELSVDEEGVVVGNQLLKDSLSDILPPLTSESAFNLPTFRLTVTGLLPSVATPLTALRMCPAITTKNWQYYSPLLAGGFAGGLVQIFNVATGELEKEFLIHSFPVRGIEWSGLKSFLSYAFPTNTSSSLVRNELCLTDVQTGESESLRTDRGEESAISMLRVSPMKQYFILVLTTGPVELWDLKTKYILRTLHKKFPIITALEWSPIHGARPLKRRQNSKEDCLLLDTIGSSVVPLERAESTERISAKEYFVFSDSESQLYHFTVDGHLLKDCIQIPPESGTRTITSIAFKMEQIVQGDSDGLLSVWDLRMRQARRHSTGRGAIMRMRFAPGKGNMKLLIMYTDGIDIIDLKESGFEKCASLKSPRDMVKVLYIDWAASDKPVFATADGCLRIMDLDLRTSSSALSDYEFKDEVYCPALLPSDAFFKLRERLSWKPVGTNYTLNFGEEHGFTELQALAIRKQLLSLSDVTRFALCHDLLCTAERCLLVAKLIGDMHEIHFWTVTLYYLRSSKNRTKDEKLNDTFRTLKLNDSTCSENLDTCYDHLQDSGTFKRLQLDRVALQESRRSDYKNTQQVIQQLLLLGQHDRVVQLLLETDLDQSEYYTDAIKACLVATVQSTGATQSTIKLVATNLIAHGTVWEGVQLLCLIGKALDACRYLASNEHWSAAVWLARCVLSETEQTDVIGKYAEHLWKLKHRESAILVLISVKLWKEAYAMLSVVDPRRAALLAQACQEFGLTVT